MNCLYILEINPLSVVSFAVIFSHSEGCLFTLLIVSFVVQKLLGLIRSHLFTFVFTSITLGGGSSEKAVAPHSSTLAWKIPWMEEPGRLQSMGSWLRDFTVTFHFHALEKEMATHSSVLAWRIPGMVEPGRLLSMGSHSWTRLKWLSSSSSSNSD